MFQADGPYTEVGYQHWTTSHTEVGIYGEYVQVVEHHSRAYKVRDVGYRIPTPQIGEEGYVYEPFEECFEF